MTRCAPRSWSRTRLLRGFGLLAGVYLASCASTRSWFIGVPAVALAIAFDALGLFALRRLDPLEVQATLRERGRGAFGVVLVGDMTMLEISLSASSPPHRAALLTPVVPVGINVDDDRGVILEPADWLEPSTPILLELLAVHAGSHVFPGILLRQSSPLGLFSCSHAVAARMTVQVLPDFVTTRDPSLAHLFRRAFRMELSSPRRIRGGGSEFHELREYRFSDPIHRIDWKATARRNDLIVREYDEPRELQLRVLLDASLDMTHDSNERSRFHAAASLVTRLACGAVMRGMRLRVTAYDEEIVLDTSLAQGNSGCMRIASQVAELSRESVVRRARFVLSAPQRHPRLMARLNKVRQTWRPGVKRVESELSGSADEEERKRVIEEESRFAADVAPALLRDAVMPCVQCGLRVFPDEAQCPKCSHPRTLDGLPPRASTLAGLLGGDRPGVSGRGILFLVSSLQGGECSEPIAELLAQLAAGGRIVHVIAPGLRRAEPVAPASSGAMGQPPDLADVLRDLGRVKRDVSLRHFMKRLQDAGVHWHEIDDDSDLEALVADAFL